MLEWFTQYGPLILTAASSITAAAGAVYAVGKVFSLGKLFKKTTAETTNQIKITQAGIVEAFKTAVVPTEWKISVSKQVAEQLTTWKNEFLAELERREKVRTDYLVCSLKILSNTKAYDALSKDDQIRTQDLIKLVDEENSTIDISEV